MSHPDLFSVYQPPHAPKRRRAMSRVLVVSEPLTLDGRAPAQFVRHCLTEYRKALHSEGRARCEFRESVRLGAPLVEQGELEAVMAREQLRLAKLEAALVARMTKL